MKTPEQRLCNFSLICRKLKIPCLQSFSKEKERRFFKYLFSPVAILLSQNTLNVYLVPIVVTQCISWSTLGIPY